MGLRLLEHIPSLFLIKSNGKSIENGPEASWDHIPSLFLTKSNRKSMESGPEAPGTDFFIFPY